MIEISNVSQVSDDYRQSITLSKEVESLLYTYF